MNKIKLEEINKTHTYQGYIWWSDRREPEVFDGQELNVTLDNILNPFIIEAQLYDTIKKKSYSIKYVDGKHIVCEYNLNDLPADVTEQSYYSNRMNERILLFKQCWRPETDKWCEGMEVLKPAECVFVGFKTKEK